MTVMPSSPTGGYQLDYNEAYQPAPKPPDVWTATIGGNALECYVVKESLNIRMGKNEPFPIGQADTGVASFDIIGEPMLHITTPLGGWNDVGGAMMGQTTDSGLSRVARTTSSISWRSNTPVAVTGKTFEVHAWFDISANAGMDARFGIDGTTTNMFTLINTDVGQNAPMQMDYRLGCVVFSKKPGTSGSGQVGPDYWGPWTPGPQTAQDNLGIAFQTPTFVVPANGWIVGKIAMRITEPNVTLSNVQQWWGTVDPILNVDKPDTFEAGEEVILKRNGTTVWTGWVTDEERSWSPSTGSLSKVNAAGPRRFYQNAVYAPEPTSYSYQFDGGTFFQFPARVGQYELQDFVDAVDLMLRDQDNPKMIVDRVACDLFAGPDGGPGGQPLNIVMWAKGAELPKPMEILDAAANTIFGFVWETRAGALIVYGPKYYAGKADPALYTADRVTLNCDDIEAPVNLRKDASMRFTRWVNRRGWNLIGHTPSAAAAAGASVEETTLVDKAGIAKYGPLDFNPSPVWRTGNSAPNNFVWEMIKRVAKGADIEQVNQWTIRQYMVDDAVWQRLLTIGLGHPVRITNLPRGLFRDGRTQFDGYCFGWQMTGTDTVQLTLIDDRVFKG